MQPMTPHEKECAFAAIASLIEKAKNRGDLHEVKKLRKFWKEIEESPLEWD